MTFGKHLRWIACAGLALSVMSCGGLGRFGGQDHASAPSQAAPTSDTEPLSLYEALTGDDGGSHAAPVAVRAPAPEPTGLSVPVIAQPAQPAPPTPDTGLIAASASSPPPSPGGPSNADSILYGIHLASYRTSDAAARGWDLVRGQSPEALAGLRARVETVDLGDGEGAFLRLKAGPLPNRGEAEARCSALTAAGHYCRPTSFAGDELPL